MVLAFLLICMALISAMTAINNLKIRKIERSLFEVEYSDYPARHAEDRRERLTHDTV